MNDWFEWNGVRCTEYGIHVSEQPPITILEQRVTQVVVLGRSGSLNIICFIYSGASPQFISCLNMSPLFW